MRSPYHYGYSSDPTFTANRPGLELWRGGCAGCGPQGVSMAGVTPVPSGTYMGPVGKTVLAGFRGSYSSGPGIPDAVGLLMSATGRAATLMSSMGMANNAQQTVMRMSGLGSTQDRAICSGITAAVGGAVPIIRDVNRSGTTRDTGFDYAGQIMGALSQIGGALCTMIQTESTTAIQQQPPGTTMPPGYIPPYRPPPAPPQPSMPAWALPVAGVAAAALIAGAIFLRGR